MGNFFYLNMDELSQTQSNLKKIHKITNSKNLDKELITSSVLNLYLISFEAITSFIDELSIIKVPDHSISSVEMREEDDFGEPTHFSISKGISLALLEILKSLYQVSKKDFQI